MRLQRSGSMVIAYLGFLSLGLVTAGLGPALPELAARSQSSLAALGSLFTALSLGAALSISVTGILTDRLGPGRVLLIGTLLTGGATIGFTLMRSLPLMFVLVLLTGLGHGAVNIATNVLVTRAFPDRSVAALNLLNVFFGVGAMASPAVAGLTMRLWSTSLSGLWLGAGLMFVTGLLVSLMPGQKAGAATRAASAGATAALRSPLVWGFGLLLLLYVGTEQGLSGWSTAYLSQTTALDPSLAALVTSGFWMTLTAGRLLAVALEHHLAPERLLGLFLAGSLAGGVTLLVSTGSVLFSVGAVLLLGLAFGPIFPTTIGIAVSRNPDSPGAVSSLLIAMGYLGGMLLPWMQGALMESAGPRISMGLVATGAAAMLLLLRFSTRPAPVAH